MKIKGKVWRGNRKGAGFVKLPYKISYKFNLQDKIEVKILNENLVLGNFYGSISSYKQYHGFYIPQKICQLHQFIGRILNFDIHKINGFYAKISKNNVLYLPNQLAEELKLKPGDLILIRGKIGSLVKTKLCRIKFRKRNSTKEFFVMFSPQFKNRYGLFNVERKLSKKSIKNPLRLILDGLDYGIWDKHKISIIQYKNQLDINPNIKLNDELFYYLGCYFADGTKKRTWAITASTFEQANFYKKMHEKLILNPEYSNSYISITLMKNQKTNLEFLKNLWEENAKIKVGRVKVRFTTSNFSKKILPQGCLVIRDKRKVTLTYYLGLLNYAISYILHKKDKKAALNFICGILEGDGSVSGTEERAFILIASNKEEIPILDEILRITGLDYKIWNEEGKKIGVRLNALGLLCRSELIFKKIFAYYPKRRKKFIKRFLELSTVRFILGQSTYCTSWVKARLKKEGILNREYKLTTKGKRIKKLLEDFISNYSQN
jgi:hypothetical protein